MTLPYDNWLAQLKAGGKGGFELPPATRGRKYAFAFQAQHDFTGATIRAEIRAAPDAGGAALATMAVTGPVVAAGVSTFTISLAAGSGANSTGALPADGDGDGIVWLWLDVLLTPSGGDEELLFGSVLPLLGRITL
jgi:hypothetical protein